MKNATSEKLPAELFDKKYFSTGNYKEYKKIADQWVNLVARRVKKSLNAISQPRVLDVGCAHGYLMTALQDMECDVVGIEYSPYAMRKAEKAVRELIRRGNILQGNNMKQNQFDAVICFNVAEYIVESDTAKAIGNLVRWSNNFIFFTTCFTHSRYASQKHSPDPLRTTTKTQKEWRDLFEKSGARFLEKFYDGSGGDILVFKKRV